VIAPGRFAGFVDGDKSDADESCTSIIATEGAPVSSWRNSVWPGTGYPGGAAAFRRDRHDRVHGAAFGKSHRRLERGCGRPGAVPVQRPWLMRRPAPAPGR